MKPVPVYTYLTDHGWRLLCWKCARVGDHGFGGLQDWDHSLGERKGQCAGAQHQTAPRPSSFDPDSVCSERVSNRGLSHGVAAVILEGEQ